MLYCAKRLLAELLPVKQQISVNAIGAILLLAIGCSRGPSRIDAPDWDPSGQAEAAIEMLDKNSDQKLDIAELQAAPGLSSGAHVIDSNDDDLVTREELEMLFSKFRDQQVGLRTPTFRLTYKGRPLTDANVNFIPEEYLAGVVEPAHGVTDFEGFVTPQVEGQPVPGMRLGFYRVEVTATNAKIPPRYQGPESPLGVNVSLSEDGSSYGANSIGQLMLVD